MTDRINVYCDESGHLEHDEIPVMILGATWCPASKTREIAERVREIKARHHPWPRFEAKWVKVSPARRALYEDLIDYFFDDDDLHFRALIAPKSTLNHVAFGQTHDEWYYKMYFLMLKAILSPEHQYRVFLDIKDTRGAAKVRKLHDVLCHNMYDFNRQILEDVQQVRSHDVEQLQIADLLIGAITYANRDLHASPAKSALVERVRKRSRYHLTRSTLLGERKFNIFRWVPGEDGG